MSVSTTPWARRAAASLAATAALMLGTAAGSSAVPLDAATSVVDVTVPAGAHLVRGSGSEPTPVVQVDVGAASTVLAGLWDPAPMVSTTSATSSSAPTSERKAEDGTEALASTGGRWTSVVLGALTLLSAGVALRVWLRLRSARDSARAVF